MQNQEAYMPWRPKPLDWPVRVCHFCILRYIFESKSWFIQSLALEAKINQPNKWIYFDNFQIKKRKTTLIHIRVKDGHWSDYDLFSHVILPSSFSVNQRRAFHSRNKKNWASQKLNRQKIKPLYSEACFFINTWPVHILNVV